jgi:hypothetical protein
MSADVDTKSRRALLRWSVASVVAAATACDFSRHYPDAGSHADVDVDTTPDVMTAVDAAGDVPISPAVDVDGMNSLLALEYRLAAAYVSLGAALGSVSAGDPLVATVPALIALAGRWRDQHVQAAAAIADVVMRAGGTPVSSTAIAYVPPSTVTLTVINILKLAGNEEKNTALAFVRRISQLALASNRQLAAAISGTLTQRFTVIYTLVTASLQPGNDFAARVANVVPTPFTLHIGMQPGLDSVADLAPT